VRDKLRVRYRREIRMSYPNEIETLS